MKMRAKGLEESRVCGRTSRFQREVWTLRRREERPDAFSIIPLPFSSGFTPVHHMDVDLPVNDGNNRSHERTGAASRSYIGP